MTCASCAARVERKLNKLEGVVAGVNYATETASVAYPPTLTPDALVAQVEAAGYTAAVPATATADESDPLRTRLITAVVLGIPVIALAMIPALRFDSCRAGSWRWWATA